METICFCELGLMASCTAGPWSEQRRCRFYTKHTFYERCSFLNPDLNNHCDCSTAQAFMRTMGEAGEEDELNIDDLLEEVDDLPVAVRARRTCIDCILYTCSHVVRENQQAQPRGGLTHEDLMNIAEGCMEYCDESMVNDSIKQIQRGIRT